MDRIFPHREATSWIPLKEDEEADSTDGEGWEKANQRECRDQAHRWPLRKIFPWLIHAALVSLYLLALSKWRDKSNAECFDDHLLNPPIVWERQHFASSVDINQGVVKDVFGSTAKMDADLETILDVGVIKISEEEMHRMPAETSHLYGNEDGYAGVLEVFHQLHCLERLRSRFQQNHTMSQQDIDHPHLAHAHNMHCFEYLWQTIKCHADVSVMSLEYNEEQQAFNANFDVVRQCRNFDVIHEWAKEREATFLPPGSPH